MKRVQTDLVLREHGFAPGSSSTHVAASANDAGQYAGTPLTFSRRVSDTHFWQIGWEMEHDGIRGLGSIVVDGEERKARKRKEQRRVYRETREKEPARSPLERLFDGAVA